MSEILKIVSVNLNRRKRSTVQAKIEKWLERHDPDLLLIQEPLTTKDNELSEIVGFKLLDATSKLAGYVADRRPSYPVSEHVERWQEISMPGLNVHNVYFPADHCRQGRQPSECRCELLSRITEKLRGSPKQNTMFLGDFNLAPRLEDGRCGDKASDFTCSCEREAFGNLMKVGNLYDATCPSKGEEPEFTKEIYHQKTRFRCDLALPSVTIRASTSVAYDHLVRKGPDSFTDHSALIATLSLV